MSGSALALAPRIAITCLLHVAHASAGAITTTDPRGDATEAVGDLVRCDVTGAGEDLAFSIETARACTFDNTQLMLDTDGSAGTGFADGANGFDLLIEGASLFAFVGSDQTQWNWRRIDEVRRDIARNRLVVHLPRSSLAGSDFRFIARSLTGAYAEVDRLPDSGAISVDTTALVGSSLGKHKTSPAVEKANDATEAARDLVDVSVVQRAAKISISARTRTTGDFTQLLVLFDTDRNPATGYRSDAAPTFGFDALLNGGRVHRFSGDRQAVWAWEGIGDAVIRVTDDRFAAEFDVSLLDTREARVVFMMMSADWQTVIDVAPDEGAVDLKIAVGSPKKQKPANRLAPPRANRDDPPRTRFAQAKSFYCYYGSGQVAALSHYDILIAHSPQMQPTDIARLKELGVVVVGYLSVGEDDKLREANGQGPGGYASWYLDENDDNAPDQNGIWKSYYANANDPAWRSDRVAEARRLTGVEGYDGIFLDTLDTASAFPQTEPGMIKLVSELRDALPTAPIVLNQGFPLLTRLAPLADGLMIESFTATYDFRKREYVLHSPSSLDWTRGVAERIIEPVVKQHGLKVLVLDYAPAHEQERIQLAADRAATFGFQFAAAPIHLDAVYPTGIPGRPDDKWRHQQATPDTLRHTLSMAANGFPNGTVLTPSGCYNGYKVAPVVDGIEDRGALYWSDAAWASAEDGDDAWLEIRFPQPLSGGVLQVRWAVDSGRVHASRRFRVQVAQGDEWTTVEEIENNDRAVTRHLLPDKPYGAVRIVQPAGGGCADRPDLMWIAQVQRQTAS